MLKMVNIGTAESPLLVPEKALAPERSEGNEWWKMVAVGSVVLGQETLDKLLEVTEVTNNEAREAQAK